MRYKSLNFNYKNNLNILKISQVLPYILLLYIVYLFIFNYVTPKYVFCDVNQITDIFKFIYCGDFEDYQLSIENIEILFSEMYTYQARPFLIVIVNFIYSFFSFTTFSNFEKIIYSYIIFNFILIIFQLYLVVNYFLRKNYELSRLRICIASLILILNPVMKFSLTEITIQTGTIIIFLLSMNYFLNYESKYVFLLGLMYLFNGSSVFFVLIILFSFLLKKVNLFKSFLHTSLLLMPYLIYRSIFLFKGIDFYNANTNYWGQFYWLNKYLYKIINIFIERLNLNIDMFEIKYFSGEWYCTDIPDFFVCYLKDTSYSLNYLLPIVLFSVLIIALKEIKINKEVYLLFLTYYLFWSLIGWYPPIRFSLYSINAFLVVVIIHYIFSVKTNLYNTLILVTIMGYLLYLENWNYFLYENKRLILSITNSDVFMYIFVIFTLLFLSKRERILK